MSIYQDMDEIKPDREEMFCTKLCNNVHNLEDNSIRKSLNEQNNEKIISDLGNIDQNNQILLTTTEIISPVAKAIEKSPEQDIELQSLSQTETNCLSQMAMKQANLQANSANEITKEFQM